MNILIWRKEDKIQYLRWWDILIITIIMFGYFIWNSISSFLYLPDTNTAQIPEFTSSANWYALIFQFVLLLLAFIYLYFRNFDFSKWKIRINLKSVLIGIALFIGVALLFDLYFMLIYNIFAYPNVDNSIFYETQETNVFLSKLSTIDLSLLLYSILNGFYEEIFFLGICLSVALDKRKYYFIYSIFVRYSFHTYQGNISAIAIGFLVGGIYYFLYTRMKEKNLFPFFLAHAITDVFGAGMISYFF
ncbi:CAAX protease self-immunity [Tissierella praeacuta DSM 18095]|uniref:CAAX protease self-immunity n=1 Tax=Tissierella praeacuta DSM 18095 TaxID=1123404 RepID=A0A1M4YM84_9FIRM|nr:CPBP family glutamic-type intramembrane protease [Tissierella praeacuta]TCU66912.1 CAAX prenyl protease-like protein [Tissierella praeacuta]SHF06890.1 CAAX protease self-immunity [Tissierella praeacuta DSM 18095]SUP02332.1 CAAX amino terminal protease self- immunity [Tissierella praeacuta]